MEQEFLDIDFSGDWQNLYNEIRNKTGEYPYKAAKLPANKTLNRYRDVSPYDHSRVKLDNFENDYINASLVDVKEARRAYILSQGPLKNTCGHFWLMVWQQCSKAVIMLNRVIEKGTEKCAQYWPTGQEGQMSFTDTGFMVRLVSEEDHSHFTTRVLELHNTREGESRTIHHFHYTTWPDFGVPESPATFLSFLFKVRESGSLDSEHGPSVVHCSAGIGRSGTFVLVDTCLLLIDKRGSQTSVDIKQVLLDLREYRMGLIQTPDQLRFSYLAVIEGAKRTQGNGSQVQQQDALRRPSRRDPDLDTPPQPPPRPGVDDSSPNGPNQDTVEKREQRYSGSLRDSMDDELPDSFENVRRRNREERISGTVQRLQQIKQKMNKSEKKRETWRYWTPILMRGAGAAVVVGLLCWIFFQ